MRDKKAFYQQITFIYTTDLIQTGQFYEEKIGLKLALDQGKCRIYHVSPDGFLGVCSCEEPREPNGIIITFVTEDVDGWYQRLLSAGVEIEKAPARNDAFQIYHCFLRDPNGYLIEIQRFLHPFPYMAQD